MYLVDATGEVFHPGFKTDVDAWAHDGETHLFEVKYRAVPGDLGHFLQVVKLFKLVKGVEPTSPFLVSVEATRDVVEEAARLGIEPIVGTILESR